MKLSRRKLNSYGFIHLEVIVLVMVIVGLVTIGFYAYKYNRAATRGLSADYSLVTGQATTPTGLQVDATSPGQIEISWDASDTPGVNYNVERNGSTVATTSDNFYLDNNVSDGTSYTYAVSSSLGQSTSSLSSSITASTASYDVEPSTQDSSTTIPAMPSAADAAQAVAAKKSLSTEISDSTNWAGYIDLGLPINVQRFNKVTGQIVVPTVKCSIDGSMASFWIGFDGFNSSTVEQVGVSEACKKNSDGTFQSSYYSWTDMRPAYEKKIANFHVVPGHTIVMTAVYDDANKGFYYILTDKSTNKTYSSPKISCAAKTICQRDSAEWMAERPTVNGNIVALADFGGVKFSNAFATIDGQTDHLPVGSIINVASYMDTSLTHILAKPAPSIPYGDTNIGIIYYNSQ